MYLVISDLNASYCIVNVILPAFLHTFLDYFSQLQVFFGKILSLSLTFRVYTINCWL